MAQIDPYLERMAQTRASLAEFFQDEPWRLRYPGGTEDGSVASELQIQAFLKEMLPTHLAEMLERGGPVTFPYSSRVGSFQCTARYLGNQLQLQIEPVQYTIVAGEDMGGQAPVLQNNSGQREYSEMPPQLRGFNVGAFLLSWIWAIGNNSMIGLLALLPCIGFFVRFYLGFKGNELAWKNKRWESMDSFRRTQGGWTIAGVVIWGLSLPGFLFFAAVLFPVFARARENARRMACQSNLTTLKVATFRYTGDHGGNYPPGTTMAEWKPALLPYLSGPDSFNCPSASAGFESYQVNPQLNGVSASTVVNPAQTWLFMDTEFRHLHKAEVVFADGHLEEMRAQG